MVDRRDVLKLGAGSIAGVLMGTPNLAFGGVPPYSDGSLQRAVFDERFEESLAFAVAMKRRNVVTSGIQGDVARLWYEDLRARLSHRPAPIAGLTNRVTLFCLEELARDVGAKVCFRVDHVIYANGHVQHEAVGPAPVVEAARKLRPTLGFGRVMAELASQFDASGPSDIGAQKRTGPFSPENKVALVSWVIA